MQACARPVAVNYRAARGQLCEINQCVGCTRQLFTKSFLGDSVAVLLGRAVKDGMPPSSRRRVDGVEVDAMARTRRKILISTQAGNKDMAGAAFREARTSRPL